jgi:hypothetical protein
MISRRAWLPLSLALFSLAANAATEIGTVTLVEGNARLLRGTTWFKLIAGTRVEDGDIIEAADRAQAQVEFAGTLASLAGPATVYLVPATAKLAPVVFALNLGWLKVAATPPGLRVRTAPFDVVVAEGVVVVHAQRPAVDFFVESGSGKLVESTPNGAGGPMRELKRGDYWTTAPAGTLATAPRAPKVFVDAMPRHFTDPLPTLAGKIKSKPTLVVDHEITYAEAEPWLAGRDRAVFERRFAGRLRDPVFRQAVEPNIARYPSWDRQLHPEKYAPKAVPAN